MTTRNAGPILDRLGVTLDLADDELPMCAVVIVHVVSPDGEVAVLVEGSEGSSWLEHLALVTAAHETTRQSAYIRPDEDA